MKFFLLLLCLTVFSCTTKQPLLEKYGFTDTEQVTFQAVASNFLFKPTAIEVFDSLILVHDRLRKIPLLCFFR